MSCEFCEMKTIGAMFLILAFICWLGARFCEKKMNEADHPTEKGGVQE